MLQLHLANRTIKTKLPAFVMGILNATPDSFWHKSRCLDVVQARDFALKMIAEGADIIDIGAESTRPGSSYVSDDEQIDRLIPIIEAIRKETDHPISIDTRKKAVFKRAFDAGADILNDVSALEDDEQLSLYCAQVKCPVILMHKRGEPQNMQNNTAYSDVLHQVCSYLKERKEFALSCGIESHKILLDAGIGFGKDIEANSVLIKNSAFFESQLQSPILVGLSRKSFLADCGCGQDRLAGSICANIIAVNCGASYVRVHDVQETVDALRVLHRIGEK